MKGRGRPRVLIVDDSAKVRGLVAEMVADTGLLPVLARDDREGLAHVRAGVDLAVSVIRRGDMHGTRFLWTMRATDRALPILLIASDALAVDILEAQALGVIGCLGIPFTHFEFREALDAALFEGRRTVSDLGGVRS